MQNARLFSLPSLLHPCQLHHQEPSLNPRHHQHWQCDGRLIHLPHLPPQFLQCQKVRQRNPLQTGS
uniref:Uncharacterized protein n=1 Tax=Arundo donax TaxID=35708 RepID=A0A0A9HUM4_ARUDO